MLKPGIQEGDRVTPKADLWKVFGGSDPLDKDKRPRVLFAKGRQYRVTGVRRDGVYIESEPYKHRQKGVFQPPQSQEAITRVLKPNKLDPRVVLLPWAHRWINLLDVVAKPDDLLVPGWDRWDEI